MFISCIRTLAMYLVLVWAVRLSGKRQIGQMEPAEFVVTMLIANLAGIPMEDGDIPLLAGLTPIATVLSAELILSWLTLASPLARRLLCGRPVILIDNGRILRENLRRTRISLDELTAQLRQKDILSIADVQFAILETGGGISVFPYPGKAPVTAEDAGLPVQPRSLPVTLVQDGRLCHPGRYGRDGAWVEDLLRRRRLRREDVLLLTVDGEDRVVLIPREKP